MKELKTAREWFEQAKAEGREWADEALREYEERPLYSPSSKFQSMPEALFNAFDWGKTPQGGKLWNKIWEEEFAKIYAKPLS